MACRRASIETVIDQLRNVSQIKHFRHRRPTHFIVNVICDLWADCLSLSTEEASAAVRVGFAFYRSILTDVFLVSISSILVKLIAI
ncbi:MAG: hypothetical protein ACFBSG_17970 [Leptolyngbyaceae cyanobacterium]